MDKVYKEDGREKERKKEKEKARERDKEREREKRAIGREREVERTKKTNQRKTGTQQIIKRMHTYMCTCVCKGIAEIKRSCITTLSNQIHICKKHNRNNVTTFL